MVVLLFWCAVLHYARRFGVSQGASSEVVYLLISRGERCGEAVASVGTEPRALGGSAGIAPFPLLSPSQPAASGAPCSSVA